MQPALIVILVVVVVAYFIVTYKPKHQENLKDLYSEGLDLMVDGYRQGAYENFKKIITKDTDNVKAYLKLGQVIREGGNPENALRIHNSLNYRKRLTYYEKIELHKNLALDYYKLNKIDNAITQCENILKINKKNDWALSKLIFFHQTNKDWRSSKKYLELKLKYNGKNDNHSIGLYKIQEGRMLLAQEKFKESRECFNESISICEDIPIAYYFIADSYSKESDSIYRLAEEIDKSDLDKQEEYRNRMDETKKILDKAISMWVSYAKLRPESSWMVIHLLKDALFALDRYNEIETILKQILEKDSDNIDVIAALADYYDHRGDSESALEIIDSGLKKDDSSLLVRLIKLKLLFSIEDTNDNLKKELDKLIKNLVQDSDYQVYKNTSTDKDAIWLYSMSEDKDK